MLNTNLLTESQDIISPAEFQLMLNDWDKEMVQLMLAAEKRYKKFKSDLNSRNGMASTDGFNVQKG